MTAKLSKLTPHQRAILRSDLVCWSGTSGRTWAYDADGESFDVRASSVEKLQTLGLLTFVGKVRAVHQYRPTEASK